MSSRCAAVIAVCRQRAGGAFTCEYYCPIGLRVNHQRDVLLVTAEHELGRVVLVVRVVQLHHILRIYSQT